MPIGFWIAVYLFGFILTWIYVDIQYRRMHRLAPVEITFIALLWPLFWIKGVLYALFVLVFGVKSLTSTVKRLFTDWDY